MLCATMLIVVPYRQDFQVGHRFHREERQGREGPPALGPATPPSSRRQRPSDRCSTTSGGHGVRGRSTPPTHHRDGTPTSARPHAKVSGPSRPLSTVTSLSSHPMTG